jgi:hypothetical protein
VESLDKSSDVFGLGAILCEILTGKPPYTGTSGNELMMKAARRDFDEQRLEGHDLGPLTKRCLAAKQSDRPQDAGELAQAIQDHLAAGEERARAAQVAAAEEQANADEACHARRLTLAIAAALLIACGLGAALWVHGEQQERERRDQIAARVDPLIEKANLLRGGGELEPALAEAKRARDLGGDDNDAGALLVAEIEQEMRDRGLVRAIDEAKGAARWSEINRGIEDALAAYHPGGIDNLVAKLLTRPPELQVRVAHALDNIARNGIIYLNRPRTEWAPRLDAAQSLDPDPWRTKMRAALRSEETARMYSVAREAPVGEPRTVVFAARIVNQTGHEGDAVRMLQRAWLRSPGDFDINETLSASLAISSEQAELEMSLAHRRTCLALRPDAVFLHAALADVLQSMGRFKEALVPAQRVVNLSPDESRGFLLVALCQYELGNEKAGKAAMAQAEQRALASSRASALNRLAWELVRDPNASFHDPQAALGLARRAVKSRPDFAALNTLAVALYRTGDFAGAVKNARLSLAAKALGYGENYNHYLLALAHWRMGEKDKARAEYSLAKLPDGTGYPMELKQFEDEAKALGIDK